MCVFCNKIIVYSQKGISKFARGLTDIIIHSEDIEYKSYIKGSTINSHYDT